MYTPLSSHSSVYDSTYSQTDCFYSHSDMSTQSTPSKRGATGVSEPILSNILPHLREDVEGKFYHPASLQDFVHHVWGVKPEVAQRILAAKWVLKQGPRDDYQATRNESDMYAPFAEIAEDLVHRVRGFMGEEGESPIIFWNARGLQAIRTTFTLRKPDMLTTHKVAKNPDWLMARQIIEFKRTDKGTKSGRTNLSGSSFEGSLQSVGEDMSLEISSESKVGSGARRSRRISRGVTPLKGGARDGRGSKRRGSVSSPLSHSGTPTSSVREASSIVGSTTASQKRKGVSSEDGTQSKRARIYPRVTLNQLQLATYALESMAAIPRHYTSGIFINRFILSLWYYDRACIIRTQDFNFDERPEILALILYALSVCDDKHTGLDPHLIAGPATDDNSRNAIIGSRMKFPSSGQATDFTIKEALFEYRGLIGRGTMVYQVSRASQCEGEDEALKISWPVTVRKREAYIIEKVVKGIPEWKDHLPEVTFSGTWTATDLQLPRVELLKTVSTLEFEDRELHVMSMKLSQKLWEVDSVNEFKDAYVDCVECHYHAFTVANVLHRDLSENNLMFKRKEGAIKGIVNDWDLASILDDQGNIPISTAKHRTGTLPFMARDLLVRDPPTHLYRHDLESLFFILVWATVHYDLTTHTRLPVIDELRPWDRGSLLVIVRQKQAFVSDYDATKAVFSRIRPEYSGVREEWLLPLWKLFRNATSSKPIEDEPVNGYDFSTYGGHLTFYTFMKALGRKPRVMPNCRVGK